MGKRIILTGGGTAGHVNPNLALVPQLEEDGFEISYIGTKKGMERAIVEKEGIPYYMISAGKLRRYFSFENFVDPFKILSGYFQSKKIIKRIKPDIVFSKGGFVAVPVVYAASRLKIPVVIHESDYTPGLANRMCMKKADRICVSFEATSKHVCNGKCVVTGSPVREKLFQGDRQKGLSFLGFTGEKKVLFVMGGSLGAVAINEVIDASLDELLAHYNIVHIRGEGNLNPALEQKPGYRQYPYLTEELPDVFAACDLMLSRAGAGTVFEILQLAIPALLIPLPKDSSRGDQVLNADYFESKGYSLVLDQSILSTKTLVESLRALEKRAPILIDRMKKSDLCNGTQNVLHVIYETLENDHG